jgi:hypothetical protein
MNGKIVLGLAATVVTVGSALALRAHNGNHRMVGKTANNIKCLRCASLWSSASGFHVSKCHTQAGGGGRTLHAINGKWYTQITTGGGWGGNTRTLVTTTM